MTISLLSNSFDKLKLTFQNFAKIPQLSASDIKIAKLSRQILSLKPQFQEEEKALASSFYQALKNLKAAPNAIRDFQQFIFLTLFNHTTDSLQKLELIEAEAKRAEALQETPFLLPALIEVPDPIIEAEAKRTEALQETPFLLPALIEVLDPISDEKESSEYQSNANEEKQHLLSPSPLPDENEEILLDQYLSKAQPYLRLYEHLNHIEQTDKTLQATKSLVQEEAKESKASSVPQEIFLDPTLECGATDDLKQKISAVKSLVKKIAHNYIEGLSQTMKQRIPGMIKQAKSPPTSKEVELLVNRKHVIQEMLVRLSAFTSLLERLKQTFKDPSIPSVLDVVNTALSDIREIEEKIVPKNLRQPKT